MKKLILIISSIFLLIIATLLLLPFLISKEKIINFTVNTIEAQVPVELELKNASLSLFPFPQVKLEDVVIRMNDGDNQHPLMQAEEINLSSSWHPLLVKEINLSLKSKGAHLHLIEIEPEKFQFESLLQKKEAHLIEKNQNLIKWELIKTAHANDKSSKPEWELKIKSLDLKETALTYHSFGQEAQTYHSLDIESDDLKMTDNSIQGNLTFRGPLPEINYQILALKSQFLWEKQSQSVTINQTKIEILDKAQKKIFNSIVNGNMKYGETLHFGIESESKKLDLASLIKFLPQAELKEQLKTLKGPLNLDLKLNGTSDNFSGDIFLNSSALSFNIPETLKLEDETLQLRSKIIKKGANLELNESKLSLGPQTFESNLKINLENLNFKTNLKTQDLRLSYLKKLTPLLHGLPSVGGKNNLSVELDGNSVEQKGLLQLNNPEMDLQIPGWIKINKQALSLNANFLNQNQKKIIESSELKIADQQLKLSGEIGPNNNFKLDLKGQETDLTKWQKILLPLQAYPSPKGLLNLDTQISGNKESQKGDISISSPSLSLKIPDSLTLKETPFSLKGQFSKNKNQTSIKETLIKLGNQSFNLNGKILEPNNKFNINLKGNGVSVKALKSISPVFKELPNFGGIFNVSAKVSGDKNSQSGSLSLKSDNFSFKIPDTLNIKEESVVLKSDFNNSNKSLEIKNASLTLADQTFNLKGKQNLDESSQWNFESKNLNLKRLSKVAPGLAGLPETKGLHIKANYSKAPDPKSEPAIEGSLSAQSIKHPEYPLQQASAKFTYAKSILKITKLKAKSLGGTLNGSAKINLTEEKPKYNFDVDVKNVNLEKLSSMKGFAKGRGSLKLKGNGKGFEDNEWKKTLDGDGNIKLSKFEVPALNVVSKIFSDKAWKGLSQVPGVMNLQELSSLKDLKPKIENLASSFEIVNGILKIPQIKLPFPNSLVELAGGISVDNQLDLAGKYVMNEKLAKALFKDASLRKSLLAGKNELVIPIKVKGKTSAPVILPDFSFIQKIIGHSIKKHLQDKAKKEVEKAIKDKAKQEIQKQISDSLKPQVKDQVKIDPQKGIRKPVNKNNSKDPAQKMHEELNKAFQNIQNNIRKIK